MSLHFTVLASGSGGNASLLAAGGFHLLLDIGLGPRQLAGRLAEAGASWAHVRAVLLTHTHSDHWNERTLAYLHRLRVPLYCHPHHHAALHTYSPTFATLKGDGLVHAYEVDRDLDLAPGLRCRPLRLRHDGGLTCGFRFEAAAEVFGRPYALGYAADLGTWTADLARALGDVDLLALEFNHDVALERGSGRSPRLIARVLGDDGHLSNAQAANLLQAVLAASSPGRLRHLIQLHLSRDCNRPALAAAAAREVLDGGGEGVELHTADQHSPSPTFRVGSGAGRAPDRTGRSTRKKPSRPQNHYQPLLPGFDEEGPA